VREEHDGELLVSEIRSVKELYMGKDRDRIHRAISDDGTEIAGRVRGQGPPLVLVHGGLEDGDLCWASLVPFLSERCTCYLPSTRGRGLSGDHHDLSPERLVEDVTAFTESIGEPVGLVGESSGGALALGAASRTAVVSAVAVYEPLVFDVFGEEDAVRFEHTVARVSDAAANDQLTDAARMFAEPLCNDDELAAVTASGYFEASGRYMPVVLQEIQHAAHSQAYSPTDPSVLRHITVPVLILHGSRTALTLFTDGVRHVAGHVVDAQIRQITGAGHWGPELQPEPIADELIRFFESQREAAA
jgi:pimeloyl-ACP methyl ester carboxylesterase